MQTLNVNQAWQARDIGLNPNMVYNTTLYESNKRKMGLPCFE